MQANRQEMTMPRIRTYSELRRYQTFEERFEYLKLEGSVGRATFGTDRYINQEFYMSRAWQMIRKEVIFRDEGCDLGIPGYEIHGELLIHHINPITVGDIVHGEEWIVDPDYLITTTKRTHNAIHFGDARQLHPPVVAQRSPNDTKLWR
jgi:hypothetical protein